MAKRNGYEIGDQRWMGIVRAYGEAESIGIFNTKRQAIDAIEIDQDEIFPKSKRVGFGYEVGGRHMIIKMCWIDHAGYANIEHKTATEGDK